MVGIYAEPYSVRHKFAAGIQVPYSSQESKNAALGSDAVKTCTGYPMTRTDATFAGPPGLVRGVPFHAGVVFGTGPVFADGYQRNGG